MGKKEALMTAATVEGRHEIGSTVSPEIVHDKEPTRGLLEHYAAFLADYRLRMTPRQADRYIGKKSNTVLGAIQRKEIRYYENGSRYEVTPIALAEWLERYDKPIEPDPLPG